MQTIFSPRIDGLKQPWKGRCWMNPPYGATSTRQWVEKAFAESKRGALVVALLPSRTGTRWFHQFIYNRCGITIQFIKGRLKFGCSKNAAPFDSMLVVFYPYHE